MHQSSLTAVLSAMQTASSMIELDSDSETKEGACMTVVPKQDDASKYKNRLQAAITLQRFKVKALRSTSGLVC